MIEIPPPLLFLLYKPRFLLLDWCDGVAVGCRGGWAEFYSLDGDVPFFEMMISFWVYLVQCYCVIHYTT